MNRSKYEDPRIVPVPKTVLLDLLETTFPDAMFGILIHPNDPPVYEVHWRGSPHMEDVDAALREAHLTTPFHAILSHQTLIEIP